MKTDPVRFHIDKTVPPVSANYRPPLIAYQSALSAHLEKLRQLDKIEDVKPGVHAPWQSNVVVTEKTNPNSLGDLRMNVDLRAGILAIKRSKTHVETVSEIQHLTAGAVRFSDLDMNEGFHQIPSIPIREKSPHPVHTRGCIDSRCCSSGLIQRPIYSTTK